MRLHSSLQHRPAKTRLWVLLLTGVAIAAPVTVTLAPGQAPSLSAAFAHARGGDDGGGRGGDDGARGGDDGGGRGRGGDDSDGGGRGRGSDDADDSDDDSDDDDDGDDDSDGGGRGGDDGAGGSHGGGHGGNHGGAGRDDRDDHDGRGRGRGRGGDDDDGGRGRGRGRGGDDGAAGLPGGGTGGRPVDGAPVRYERSARGIEVTYADGWREELEEGRYELKDPQNRTVVERPATQEDYDRLGAIIR